MTKVIAVGGVAGGATAAGQLRRLDPDIGITIYERYEEISYGSAACLITSAVKLKPATAWSI